MNFCFLLNYLKKLKPVYKHFDISWTKIVDMKDIFLIFLVALFAIAGCSGKKVPLDRKQFIALLIDMHMADGTLTVNDYMENDEKRNYVYYNAIFQKYGITKSDFDSCMSFYSARTALFSQMYDVIIDSLNVRQTNINRIMTELKSRDSINLFPLTDTIRFDSTNRITEVEIDSITPGLYRFSTTIKFDVPDKGKNNRITAFFLSADGKDSLKVRNVNVITDTIKRYYSWSQYADSIYSRLIIRFIDSDNLKKLDERRGQAWETNLFRPYISGETEKRMKSALKPGNTQDEVPVGHISDVRRVKQEIRVQ